MYVSIYALFSSRFVCLIFSRNVEYSFTAYINVVIRAYVYHSCPNRNTENVYMNWIKRTPFVEYMMNHMRMFIVINVQSLKRQICSGTQQRRQEKKKIKTRPSKTQCVLLKHRHTHTHINRFIVKLWFTHIAPNTVIMIYIIKMIYGVYICMHIHMCEWSRMKMTKFEPILG